MERLLCSRGTKDINEIGGQKIEVSLAVKQIYTDLNVKYLFNYRH